MKCFLPIVLLALAATPSLARERGPQLRPAANPSAVIARELEFAQAAKDKGQWTAFRAFAAEDAVMFVPHMVFAQGWLKDRANPPVAVSWQPTEVWSSCDGSLVVSHGAWQRPNSVGYFTTIWQRQDDGKYKWVFDHGDELKEAVAVPDLIPAHVADCADKRGPGPGKKAKKGKPAPLDPARRAGKSDDGTIAWEVTATPEGAHNLSVEWVKDGSLVPLTIEEVAAPETK